MFYGEYAHSIDNKGRLIIPSKFREAVKDQSGEKFYMTRGLDSCLFVFTEEEWRLQEQKFKALSFTSAQARQFNRLFFSGACEVECDTQGRILIPSYLKEYAQIDRKVMIVGVANRFEIWSESRWQAFYTASKESFECIAEQLTDSNKIQ